MLWVTSVSRCSLHCAHPCTRIHVYAVVDVCQHMRWNVVRRRRLVLMHEATVIERARRCASVMVGTQTCDMVNAVPSFATPRHQATRLRVLVCRFCVSLGTDV